MRRATVATATVVAAAASLACLWDKDTLREESLGQKEIAATVNGDIGKHSDAFYAAKVTYTQALVDKGSAPKERYDDLAVALARTGKLDEAIAVLAAKEKKFPGEYTTEANLGTFLAMKGDLDGAIAHLEAGIKINPDAHFGREKYQLQLLRDAKAAKTSVKKADACATLFGLSANGEDAMWVMKPGDVIGHDDMTVPPKDAAVAMAGLIRFGVADQSPAVWFNLGVALAYQGHKQLAVRALHRADTLGHPCAATFGQPLAMVVPEFERAAHGRDGAWGVGVAKADADWKKGEAAEAARQKAEDKLVAAKKYRRAFGF
jgi:tetratricopeptide (TPR) repeat protein